MCSTHLQVESLPQLVLVAPGMGPSRVWTTHLGMSKIKEARGTQNKVEISSNAVAAAQKFLGGDVLS